VYIGETFAFEISCQIQMYASNGSDDRTLLDGEEKLMIEKLKSFSL
jgi:hypothetical protein